MANNTMRITGFASGLDTTQIINDLMTAERAPLDKLFQKKEWLTWQRDAYREVNLELSTFQSKVDKLRFSTAFNGYKATSTNTENATVTAKSSAIAGSYELEVLSLAEVARVKTSSAIQVSGQNAKSTDKVLAEGQTSSIEISTTKGTATISITDEDTFSSLASKIASATNVDGQSLGLRASFDATTSAFVISTKDMGAEQSITIKNTAEASGPDVASLIVHGGSTGTSSGANETVTSVTGKNAKIIFDGTDIEQASNKFSVYGLELNLIKTGTTSTISVQSDTDSIFNNIKEFVDSYNSLIDSLTSKVKTTRDRDYAPLTEEQREILTEKEAEKWDAKAKEGLLYNDSIIRGTLSKLRTDMYTTVDEISSGQIRLLSQIGIKPATLSKDGKLEINEETLRNAIANNPDEVANLFTATDGIASRVYNELTDTVNKLNEKAGRPNTASNIDFSSLGKSLTEVNKQMVTWEDKLETIENRYWKQFTAMETALNKMNEQSSYISGMFSL